MHKRYEIHLDISSFYKWKNTAHSNRLEGFRTKWISTTLKRVHTWSTKEKLKSALRKCEIFPLNRIVVLSRLCGHVVVKDSTYVQRPRSREFDWRYRTKKSRGQNHTEQTRKIWVLARQGIFRRQKPSAMDCKLCPTNARNWNNI